MTTSGVQLHRAADAAKDQSYVLGVLNQDQLRAVATSRSADSLKTQVRAEAAERGLAVADKPDSHDICFIADGDTAGFLSDRLGETARRHRRRRRRQGRASTTAPTSSPSGSAAGLRLGHPGRGRPAAVRAGHHPGDQHRDRRSARRARRSGRSPAIRPTWTGDRPVTPWSGHVQLRAHGQPLPATVPYAGDELSVIMDDLLARGRAGSGAVLYDGTRVVGSATIIATS